MVNDKVAIPTAMFAVLVIGILFVESRLTASELSKIREQRDSLQLAVLAEEAEKIGFATQVGELSTDIDEIIEGKNAQFDSLLSTLDRAQADVVRWQEIAASAEGTVTSDTVVVVQEVNGVPMFWAGAVSDGLLTGEWEFNAVDQEFALDYRVFVPISLIDYETSPGNRAVSAVSSDPRVSLNSNEYLFTPSVVTETRCPLLSVCTLARVGAGVVLWEIAR